MKRSGIGNHTQYDADDFADAGLGDPFQIGYPGELSPGYAALISGGLTEVGILGAKNMGKGTTKKYAYLYGAGLGLGSAGVMYFMGHHRGAMMGGAVSLLVAGAELVRAHFIESRPGYNSLGYYDSDFAGSGEVELLGAYDYSDTGEGNAAGSGGGIELLGGGAPPSLAASPSEVMGLYQPEMAGAWGPYSGAF